MQTPDAAPSARRPTIFLSAGDASGDLHAAALVAELRARLPSARFVGFGGRAMREAGAELLAPLADDPVMGFSAVLPALGRFARLLAAVDRSFADAPPDVVVPVDYPGFNVRLGRLARRRSIPVVYYVCPQYWGWAPWRARRFARSVDLGLTILPFEAPFLARRGVRARHVGHPLADRLAATPPATAAACSLGIVAGSRRREIDHLLAWELRAARRLMQALGAAIPLLAAHPVAALRGRMAAIARAEGVALEVRDQPLPELLSTCRAALVTSGTATLECALLRVPSVIVYRVNRLLLWASRYALTAPYIGLPNLLAGRALFPEHLCAGDPAPRLAADLEALWREGAARDRCIEGLDRLRGRLLAPGATARAADAILETMR